MSLSNRKHLDDTGVSVGRQPRIAAVGDAPRPLTDTEQAGAESIGHGAWRFYALWVDAGFSHDEIADWYPSTAYRSYGPEVAVQLRSAGFTTSDLREAITASAEPGYRDHQFAGLDMISAANRAVLWQEVAEYHRAAAAKAALYRNDALSAARAVGATTTELATRLGWSRQRISQLAPTE